MSFKEVQYLTDAEGHQTAAVVPIKVWQTIMDSHDPDGPMFRVRDEGKTVNDSIEAGFKEIEAGDSYTLEQAMQAVREGVEEGLAARKARSL